MPRLVIPTDFPGQKTLFTSILAQHKFLGTKSPLIAFAKQQKMDLVKLEAAIEPAAAKNQASGSLRKDSENDTQQRNLLLATPEANLHDEVDYLKRFYAGMERELGKWGITVDGENRVAYPTGVVATAELIQTFLAYHLSIPEGESPLQLYIDEHEINVQSDLAAAGDAIKMNTEQKETTGDSQEATQQRNLMWEPVAEAIHKIGDFLMGLYKQNSRKMAAWGYKVVESGAKETLQTSDLLPLESRATKGVVLGAVFTNIGDDILHLQKGDKIDENKTVVKPGEQVGMTKGYSAITVFNPSTLKAGKYTVMVHR